MTAGTKQFKAVWTKIGTQTTGYQLQYSTSSTFKTGNKTVNVKGYAKTAYVIKRLKVKKTYYVRIRTYLKTGGAMYYSKWSAKKKIKTQ